MNWILLITAGLMEVAFTFCLGKTKTAAGAVVIGILFFHEPANFWRIFFLTTLILSIVGLKFV